jgi:hypothetical protein
VDVGKTQNTQHYQKITRKEPGKENEQKEQQEKNRQQARPRDPARIIDEFV